MIETVLQLLPKERGENIGVLSDDGGLVNAIETHIAPQEARMVELRRYNLRQLPFPGEFFEALVIDDDTLFEDERKIGQLKKVIQKNRCIVVLSKTLERRSLCERLEPMGFSDFSTIEAKPKNITLLKKWFTFEQSCGH